MAFADPEAVAAILESVEQTAREAAELPGAQGAMGRCAVAYRELTAWLISERDRGTAFEDIAEASAHIAGSLLASTTMSIARKDGEAAVLTLMLRTTADCAASSLKSGTRYRAPIHEGRRH